MRAYEVVIYMVSIIGCGASFIGALTSKKKIFYAGFGLSVVASLVLIIAGVVSA